MRFVLDVEMNKYPDRDLEPTVQDLLDHMQRWAGADVKVQPASVPLEQEQA